MREPTFYVLAALDRLTAEGHVQLVSEQIVGGRPRRTYGLTESGSAALRAEAVRMAEAAELVIGRTREANAGPLPRKLRAT
jgi:predicted ArsR family transcriptional regulator